MSDYRTTIYNYWKQAGIALIFRRANSSMSILRVISMSKFAMILGISTFMLETISTIVAMILIALIWIAIERHFRKKRPHEQETTELKNTWITFYWLTSDEKQREKLITLSQKNLNKFDYFRMIIIEGGLYLTVIWSIIRTIFLICAPTATIPYYLLCLILIASVLICALIIHQSIAQEQSEHELYTTKLKKLTTNDNKLTQAIFKSEEYTNVQVHGYKQKDDEYILQDRSDGSFYDKPYKLANYLSITIISSFLYFFLLYKTNAAFMSLTNLRFVVLSLALAGILASINNTTNQKLSEKNQSFFSSICWYFNSLATSIGFYCLIQWGMPFHYITGPIYIGGAILSSILFAALCYWRNTYISYVIEHFIPFIALAVGWSSAETLFNTFFLFLGIPIQAQFTIPCIITIKYLFMLAFASSYALCEAYKPSTTSEFNNIVYRIHQGNQTDLEAKGFTLQPN